jgi:hypothetical protein
MFGHAMATVARKDESGKVSAPLDISTTTTEETLLQKENTERR